MNRHHPADRQRGAVAIMTAFSLVLLIAMIGLVVDLGYLYTRKTELQNAADAAALAGARELNGTTAGVTAAVLRAIALANANASDLDATPVDISNAEIEFGPGPDGPWETVAISQADPEDKFFIKVDTSGIAQGTRPTWFMGVVSSALANTNTFGLAVAGRTVCEGLPIFTCVRPGGGYPDYGFVKGASYRLATPSAAGGGSDNIGWMDPVPPTAPKLITGANEFGEVVCRGQSYCINSNQEYRNLTQLAFNPTYDALNTRFGVYEGKWNKAEYKLACPADTNIKEYEPTVADQWLNADPIEQADVRWSAVRPEDLSAVTNYPTSGTPYSQTASSAFSQYFDAPPTTLKGDPVASQTGRRILTIGLADLPAGQDCLSVLNGASGSVKIVRFARFLMQIPAAAQGNPKGAEEGIYGEFIDTVASPPAVISEIKLFR